MARFSLFRDLADFFSYKRRRIINWAVIALSVIPGTIYWLLPATLWRNWFIFEYLSVIGLGIVSQRRFLYRFTAMTAFALFSWRRYRPTRYSSPEMDGLARQMRILGKVQVFTTDNPFVDGPFTFCFARTCRIYIPTNWIQSFHRSEILAVLAHEFAHVSHRLRFLIEGTIAIAAGWGFAMLLNLLAGLFHTELLLVVFMVAEIAVAWQAVSFFSWRNEYRADWDGAKITGPEGLIAVLQSVGNRSERDEGSETHPPLSKRIQRLEKLLDKPKLL